MQPGSGRCVGPGCRRPAAPSRSSRGVPGGPQEMDGRAARLGADDRHRVVPVVLSAGASPRPGQRGHPCTGLTALAVFPPVTDHQSAANTGCSVARVLVIAAASHRRGRGGPAPGWDDRPVPGGRSSVHGCRHAPHVHIVRPGDPRYCGHLLAEVIQVDVGRGLLQQHTARVARGARLTLAAQMSPAAACLSPYRDPWHPSRQARCHSSG